MSLDFAQIAKKIEMDIKNGTYPDTLPSITSLAKMFQVCTSTVKRSLSLLRSQDLVSGEHGRCVRVNSKAVSNPYFRKNVIFLTSLVNLSMPFYAETLELLTKLLFEKYISVHIFISENQANECSFTPDCVVFINSEKQVLLDTLLRRFPDCNVIKLNQRSSRFPYVITDNYNAGYKAMRHLAEDCGHTHIGILATQLHYPQAIFHQRYCGAMDYAKKHPSVKLSMVEVAELDLESAGRLMPQLMKKDPQISAVFASCDIMALGVYGYAARYGLKIPEDLAVIGVDNQSFGKSLVPPLTTMSENVKETADHLYFGILNLLMNNPVDRECFTQPYLIEKESTVKNLSRERGEF